MSENYSASGFYSLQEKECYIDITVPDIPQCSSDNKNKLKTKTTFFIQHEEIIALFVILSHYKSNDRRSYAECMIKTNEEITVLLENSVEQFINKSSPKKIFIAVVPIHDEDIDFNQSKFKKILEQYVISEFKKATENNTGYDEDHFQNYLNGIFLIEDMIEPKTVGQGGVLRPGTK